MNDTGMKTILAGRNVKNVGGMKFRKWENPEKNPRNPDSVLHRHYFVIDRT